jgi:nucleolin
MLRLTPMTTRMAAAVAVAEAMMRMVSSFTWETWIIVRRSQSGLHCSVYSICAAMRSSRQVSASLWSFVESSFEPTVLPD